jgi:hypothetical protein
MGTNQWLAFPVGIEIKPEFRAVTIHELSLESLAELP